MELLTQVGLCLLAVGALSGWAVVARVEKPELLERFGITRPARLLQAHIDFVLMGLILVAVGLALPDLQTWIAAPLVFGTIVNPSLFLPLAWDEGFKDRLLYRAVSVVSFAAMSFSLTAAAVEGLSR